MLKLKLNDNNNDFNKCNIVKKIRYEIIRDIASYQTSAPARNYLLSCWLEEKYDIENIGGGNFSDIIMGRPIEWSIKTLPFHVDPIKCKQNLNRNIINTGIIQLCDIGKIYRLKLKQYGVMELIEINNIYNDKSIDWILKTKEKILKYILTDNNKKRGGDNKEKIKTGHMIPRIRTGCGALIAVLFGIIAGKDAHKNGLIKGKGKAIEFFKCLEYKVVSKL